MSTASDLLTEARLKRQAIPQLSDTIELDLPAAYAVEIRPTVLIEGHEHA